MCSEEKERIYEMKSIKKFLVTILALMTIFSLNITAMAEENWQSLLGTVVDGSVLTDQKESTGIARDGVTRGYYLSDGSSYILNEGNNMVYISGSTVCYRTADEIRTDVFLQRLVNGNWETVAYRHQTDYNTYYAHNGFEVIVTSGYFYRTVTNHVVIKGSTTETLTSETDGLYI